MLTTGTGASYDCVLAMCRLPFEGGQREKKTLWEFDSVRASPRRDTTKGRNCQQRTLILMGQREDTASKLIEMLYETVEQPDAWNVFVESLSETIDCFGIAILSNSLFSVEHISTFDFRAPMENFVSDQWYKFNIRTEKIATYPFGKIVTDRDILSRRCGRT